MVLSGEQRAYPEGPFRTVYARLVDEGFVDHRESRGLSECELGEISQDQGAPLDPEYADFPRRMGAGQGRTRSRGRPFSTWRRSVAGQALRRLARSSASNAT